MCIQLLIEKIKSIGHRRGQVRIRHLFSMLLFVWFFWGGTKLGKTINCDNFGFTYFNYNQEDDDYLILRE